MEEAVRADVVSVGIEINKVTHLHKINQQEALQEVIETLKYNLGLPQSQKYALQFDKRNCFVTESNRKLIKDGDVCHLVYAPEVLVTTILSRLHERWAMSKLLDFVGDNTLVEQLELQDGVSKLVTILQDDELLPEVKELAFQVVAELFKQDKVPLEWMKGRLLKRVRIQVSGEFVSSDKTLAACLGISLALLGQPGGRYHTATDQVPLDKVVTHLESRSQEVVEAALALVNARSETLERRCLLRARDLLASRLQAAVWPLNLHFQQQLILFQTRLISRLVKKFENPADENDAKVRRRLSTLTAADAPGRPPAKETFAETTLRLLAESVHSQGGDQCQRPSLLLIDCLTHSVRLQLHQLSEELLRHKPFLYLCEQLVKLQMESLGLLSKAAFELHPILFCDRAFEEMFCACVRALNKTCKEMRAKGEDLSKILRVHAKKMQMVLDKRPLRLDKFEEILNNISYNQVWEMWLDEQDGQQKHSFRQKASFLEMREQLRPQYEALVKFQRLRVMTAGCTFLRYASKGHSLMRSSSKDRLINVKYSPNTKSFTFADPEEGNFRIELAHIKNVLNGQNCPHAKLRSKNSPEYALSINLTNADFEFLNLGATSGKEQDYWSDGIRMLIGQNMVSESYTNELRDLMDMHMKIHFLGMEDVVFPDGPAPPIPEPPSFSSQLDIGLTI